MVKIVKITYDDASKKVSISSDSQVFDVTRIDGRDISDWLYPFMVKGVRWNGLYDELKDFIGAEEFSILFDGSDKNIQALKTAVNGTPAKVASTNNKVVILYQKEALSTKITINGKIFDTTRIQNRPIDEWVYPFQFGNVKWDGIFAELEKEIGINIYEISFVGEQNDMKEIINNCPETVDVTFRAPVASKASAASNAGKALSNVAAAGSSALSGAKEKIGNFTQNNENAQKAKAAAVNAGKKIDAGVSNAVANIKNSETYNKVMENEKVQKVMSNEKVQKVSGFWSKLDKKVKYAIGIVAALLIISVPLMLLFGGNTLELEPENQFDAMKCKHECDAGMVGFMGEGDPKKGAAYALYFKAADHTVTYLVKSEDGQEKETIAAESDIYGRESSGYNFDTDVYGKDVDGDGYVEFTISEFTGSGYEEVCTILGKVKE